MTKTIWRIAQMKHDSAIELANQLTKHIEWSIAELDRTSWRFDRTFDILEANADIVEHLQQAVKDLTDRIVHLEQRLENYEILYNA